MQTITSKLQQEGENLFAEVTKPLGSNTPLRDINAQSNFVFIGAHHEFNDLPAERKRLQSRLLEDHQHFIAIVRALLRAQPNQVRVRVDQHATTICEIIEQTHLVWHSTTDEAKVAVGQAIKEILRALSSLYDPGEGRTLLIPDTNALIYCPSFQKWKFDRISAFEILLVPTLLSELDSLKNEHRNPDVRQKAQDVIRQIKEYRRRGNLNDGVTVVADCIRLRSTAIEPRADEVLPWLDPLTPDDRMLASCIESMRAHPRSIVILVTGDINLQNKAEFARIPFIEPPSEVSAIPTKFP